MKENKKIIDSFKNQYYFLSNFYETPVTFLGITYKNNEAAFQAMKVCVDQTEIIDFLTRNKIKIDYNSEYDEQNKYSIIEHTLLQLKRSEFANLPPNEAKRLGRRVKLRADWETVKDQVMFDVCCAKFNDNEYLAQLLVQTGDAILIEGNTWNDTYWGVCNGKGKNMLGKILMQIREEKKKYSSV